MPTPPARVAVRSSPSSRSGAAAHGIVCFRRARASPADEMFDEDEEVQAQEPEAHVEPTVESESEPIEEISAPPVAIAIEPVKEPVPTVRSRKTERQPSVVSRGVLAAVVSRQSAVASHVAAAEKASVEERDGGGLDFASSPASHEPALVSAGAVARGEQQTFRLGDEDRGRFKDTEPSISDGEDLDVPTWMRLRKKARQ